jgi:periplasmic copper chaperone A
MRQEKLVMKKSLLFCTCASLLAVSSVSATPLVAPGAHEQHVPSWGALQILVADSSDVTAGDLTIKNAFTRPTLGAATVAVGYVTVVNNGKTDDRLIGASSDISDTTEIHESKMANGVMEMHEVKDGLAIPAGATVALQPGSYHIMFVGIKEAVKAGSEIHAVLNFGKAGKVDVTFPATSSPGATAPDMGSMKGMDMNGMGNMKMQ